MASPSQNRRLGMPAVSYRDRVDRGAFRVGLRFDFTTSQLRYETPQRPVDLALRIGQNPGASSAVA